MCAGSTVVEMGQRLAAVCHTCFPGVMRLCQEAQPGYSPQREYAAIQAHADRGEQMDPTVYPQRRKAITHGTARFDLVQFETRLTQNRCHFGSRLPRRYNTPPTQPQATRETVGALYMSTCVHTPARSCLSYDCLCR